MRATFLALAQSRADSARGVQAVYLKWEVTWVRACANTSSSCNHMRGTRWDPATYSLAELGTDMHVVATRIHVRTGHREQDSKFHEAGHCARIQAINDHVYSALVQAQLALGSCWYGKRRDLA